MDQSLRHIIRERVLLKENLQQAEKLFFNETDGIPPLLDQEDKRKILDITHGDGFTKIISNIYYLIYKEYSILLHKYIPTLRDLELIYDEIKNYNTNLLPIKNWDQIMGSNKIQSESDLHDFVGSLSHRRQAISRIGQLPSMFKRNTKDELRKERNMNEMEYYNGTVSGIVYYFDGIKQRPEHQRDVLIRKIFSSENNTADKVLDFIEEADNTRAPFEHMDDVYAIISNHDGEIVEDNKRYIIVKATDNPLLIKDLGCNASWCFSKFSSSDSVFYQHSTNGIVYWIMDKSNLESQWVLIGPYELYNIDNQPEEISVLDHLNIDWSRLNFEVPA